MVAPVTPRRGPEPGRWYAGVRPVVGPDRLVGMRSRGRCRVPDKLWQYPGISCRAGVLQPADPVFEVDLSATWGKRPWSYCAALGRAHGDTPRPWPYAWDTGGTCVASARRCRGRAGWPEERCPDVSGPACETALDVPDLGR